MKKIELQLYETIIREIPKIRKALETLTKTKTMGKMKALFMKLREQELMEHEMKKLANEDRILQIQEQEKIEKEIREKQNKKDKK